ncbi:NAD(P)-binding protein [Halapricum sp. CBA1109]|uniref:NAD(P)/FAD-dependent oxidoreductase n=1 Tax=Halapricum sp. CBA1109 TaxID=2668068 RepID=UPI0012FBCA6F|nr:FAD-dependent oxidoreductase [Halapricum sp. CBA1109]MUV90514.1 NAD(P)-binding protein [Halapricum sp. CBA1109]
MTDQTDIAVVGGGVAGLMAATYTARHDFETRVFDTGASILRRNAHLENVPGFPVGVDARLWLDMLAEQAERAGATLIEAEVTAVTDTEGGTFRVETAAETFTVPRVVLATKNDVSYLDVEGVGVIDRGKTFLDTDERGRTGVDGCYAAGRLAEKPHQAAVAAGHGAEVGVALLEDADVGFYHDWVAPDGYFTDRGRDLPPGCEEVDRETYERRREQAHRTIADRFSDPDLEPPETHPSLQE